MSDTEGSDYHSDGSVSNEDLMDKINKISRLVHKIAKQSGVGFSSDEDSPTEDYEKKPKKQRTRRSKNFLQQVRSSCPPNDRSAFEYVVINFHVCADVIRRCVPGLTKSFPESRVTNALVSLQ
jgi:hypothetical protein